MKVWALSCSGASSHHGFPSVKLLRPLFLGWQLVSELKSIIELKIETRHKAIKRKKELEMHLQMQKAADTNAAEDAPTRNKVKPLPPVRCKENFPRA